MRAIVIGSGIGGPVAATALRRAGIDVSVHEAHAGPGITLGAQLNLAPNGLAVLRTLGLLDAVLAAPGTIPNSAIDFRSGTGRRLGMIDDGSTALEEGLQSVSVRRGELQAALARAASDHGVTVEYGRRFVRHTDTGSSVVAEFEDGSTEEADILIGADGIHSRVRRGMDPSAPAPVYTGLLDQGGWTSAPGLPTTPPSTSRLVWGRRAFFGYQSAPDGTVYWFVNTPHRDLDEAELRSHDAAWWKRSALDLFTDQMPEITAILEASEERWFTPRAVHTIPTLPHWVRGRVGLLGDAAHALPNSSGQGASMALEDAATLATCLRDVTGPAAALATYERLRRPRVERIITEGTQRGDLKLITNPVGVFLRDRVLLPLVFRMVARTEGHSWIFDHRVDFDARVSPVG
ncbi:FAD-dependent monooxygenase [Nocardiopsis sp. NPDC049922]|uniref:FAD-dependent oxidoreductase n=1 Tax=Nocardiopsis sp. NPDC049922 TaxID=3155157 RepID=UPI0033BFF69E